MSGEIVVLKEYAPIRGRELRLRREQIVSVEQLAGFVVLLLSGLYSDRPMITYESALANGLLG